MSSASQSRQVRRQARLDLAPLHQRKIAERMAWRRLCSIGQVQVVEPRTHAVDVEAVGSMSERR